MLLSRRQIRPPDKPQVEHAAAGETETVDLSRPIPGEADAPPAFVEGIGIGCSDRHFRHQPPLEKKPAVAHAEVIGHLKFFAVVVSGIFGQLLRRRGNGRYDMVDCRPLPSRNYFEPNRLPGHEEVLRAAGRLKPVLTDRHQFVPLSIPSISFPSCTVRRSTASVSKLR